VNRLVILTGSGGGVGSAISAALAARRIATRHVPFAADGRLALEVDPRGAEAVVHLGLRTPRELDEPLRTEAEATAAAAAAELARAAGARRLVHVSTVAVYGKPRNLPCRESELKRPRTAHERIRWRAEQASWAAFRRGAPLTVLRPTILYGPGLKGGPVRVLPLVALFNGGRRRVPIIRRGPVAHLCHVQDLARAVAHVILHDDDGAVVGRAFNVGDDAPLPLAEHLEAALSALGLEAGRVLPSAPRLWALLLWLFRHVPDRVLVDPVNRRLARRWTRLARRSGVDPVLGPRVDREALHWMSADHYYDTRHLREIGWSPIHPVSTVAVASSIRALVAQGLLPGTGAAALPAW
jgi:nucleoside-diphosphate-sugar epimerase